MVSATSSPLPCSLFPCQGSSESLAFCRTLVPWTKNQRCGRRKAATSVTAKLELKPPPYPLDALEPHMSEEILTYHWGKHHRGYVENLNKQVAETELDAMALEDIIALTYNKGDMLPPFNNAAQIWNHEFFWESMRPNGGGRPSGDLLELIERDFGSFEKFSKEFQAAALTQFGSGWTWLAYKANRIDVGNAVNPRPTDEDKKLVVVKSPNAVNPLVWDYSPLLTIDVWEHAYYLDYKNRRADYISTFMDKLVSWKAVSSRLVKAKAKAAEREKQEERRRQEEDGIAGFGRRQEEDGIAKFDKNSEALDTILDSEIDEAEAE